MFILRNQKFYLGYLQEYRRVKDNNFTKRNSPPTPRNLMVTHESWSTSFSLLTWISPTAVSIPQWLLIACIKHVWWGRLHKSQKISKFYGSLSFLFQSKQRTRNSLYRSPTLYIIHSFFFKSISHLSPYCRIWYPVFTLLSMSAFGLIIFSLLLNWVPLHSWYFLQYLNVLHLLQCYILKRLFSV